MDKCGNISDVVIIGGGPAGIMAAIRASDLGFKTVILEANDRIGKKLLLTGDGKCNLTNILVKPLNYHSSNRNFAFKAIKEFSNRDTMNFFKTEGLLFSVDDDGKVFPVTFQSSTVLDILRLALSENNVKIIANFKVKEVVKKENLFLIENDDQEMMSCRKIIFATGGKSFPNTGSDGSGYKIAQKLGHRIIDPRPALVQLKLNSNYLKTLSGIRVNAGVKVLCNDLVVTETRDEILFTSYGISGPAILHSSTFVSDLLNKGKRVYLEINLLPDLTNQLIVEFISSTIKLHPKRNIQEILTGIANKRIVLAVLKMLEINNLDIGQIRQKHIEELANLLTHLRFEVSDTLTFATAQVTSGGVDTRDIYEDTLESKIVKGLYFAGEIIDVNGDSGGYNLQWAWSTGWVAGSLKSK